MPTVNFPENPTNGEAYVFARDDGSNVNFSYDQLNNRWLSTGVDGGGAGASVIVSAVRPNPADSNVGDLWWYCGSEMNDPGLFTLVEAPIAGTTILVKHWMQSSPGIVGGAGGAEAGGLTFTGIELVVPTGALVNGFDNSTPILTSDFGFDPALTNSLTIPEDFWVWSDNVATPAITVDTANLTIINNGKIIGKGGRGNGQAGGHAIQVDAALVTVINNAGAYIAGGGGGGGSSGTGGGTPLPWGGGGGAGGGQGGAGTAHAGGAGGTLNMVGGVGSYGGGNGGGAGGGNGTNLRASGGGGGRILPGVGGGTAPNMGGSAGDPGGTGSGGGWGAAGGDGNSQSGGAGGSAIAGLAVTLTNDGTIYGFTST